MAIILVPKGTEGLGTEDVGSKMGIRMTSTAEVSYEDVRVPLENIVGAEGKGFYQVRLRLQIAQPAPGPNLYTPDDAANRHFRVL